jgi:hypothetical protein
MLLGATTDQLNFNFTYFSGSCFRIVDFDEHCFQPGFLGSTRIEYHGRATFQQIESPAVPEPTTLALVGTGLVFGARRLRASRRTGRTN